MIILSGTNSPLAQHLLPVLRDRHQVCSFDREMGDIKNPEFSAKLISQVKPHIFINTIQFENTEECEYKREEAYQINAFAPGYIAAACKENGVKLIHISTSSVYKSDEDKDYSEADSPDPQNAYADSKLLGEHKIMEILPDSLIVRFPFIYGRGESFLKEIIQHARTGEELKILKGQLISSIYAKDATDAILAAIENGAKGIYNIANSGHSTVASFAESAVSLYRKFSGKGATLKLKEQSYSEYLSAAEPLMYNRLDISKYKRDFKTESRTWHLALEVFLAENWQFI